MMTEEEYHEAISGVGAIPAGYMYTLVLASLTKWVLTGNPPPDLRIQFLEHLDKMLVGQRWLTAEMIAHVQPMCKQARELAHEAAKLGPQKELDALAKHFKTFAQLNPSLIEALKMSPTCQATKPPAPTEQTNSVDAGHAGQGRMFDGWDDRARHRPQQIQQMNVFTGKPL